MDSLWEEFDDLELCCDPPQQFVDDKGKRPAKQDACTDDEEEAITAHQAPNSPSKCSEPGDMTCAICLNDIHLPDMAMVKGCEHIYCAKCIVAWALHREWCPQCKQPFSYLLTYRTLDGELQDFPTEESLVLLKRARWLEHDLKSCLDDVNLLDDSRTADDLAWHDYADDYDLADDEAIEQFYFSSAAGRARVTFGNRRFGEGGYITGGRRCARPVANNKKGGKGKATPGGSSSKKGQSSGAGTSRDVGIRTPNANGGRKQSASMSIAANNGGILGSSLGQQLSSSSFLAGESPGSGGAGSLYGSSPAGTGRRAKRNARRAAFDTAVSSSLSSSVPRRESGFVVANSATEDDVGVGPAAIEPVSAA